MAKKQDGSSRKVKSGPRLTTSKPSKIANAQVSGPAMTEDNKKTTGLPAPRQRGISNEMIGSVAGDVWSVLSERGGQTLAGLKKSIDAPDELVLAAVGWLAREDKLEFQTNGRTMTITLR